MKMLIEKYTTSLGDRLTRRLANRFLDTDGELKSGYVLLIGILIGYLIWG